MEVSGNIDFLKNEIQKSYIQQLEIFQKEQTEKFRQEVLEIEKAHKKKLSDAEKMLRDEERKMYRATLFMETLNVKQEYEQTREELIDSAFRLAKIKAKEFLLSEDYINTVRKSINESSEINGGFDEYRRFFQQIKILPKMDGIIIKNADELYDFTYTMFIESKKHELRQKLCKILFENGN